MTYLNLLFLNGFDKTKNNCWRKFNKVKWSHFTYFCVKYFQPNLNPKVISSQGFIGKKTILILIIKWINIYKIFRIFYAIILNFNIHFLMLLINFICQVSWLFIFWFLFNLITMSFYLISAHFPWCLIFIFSTFLFLLHL